MISRPFLSASVLLFATLMSACAPSVSVPKPPAASIGDDLLTVTIRTDKHRLLPQRSRVVITISDTSLADAPAKALAGDEIVLRRSDKSLRLSIPVDKAALAPCTEEGVCTVSVHVEKDGVLRFINDTRTPFKAGQRHVRVTVTKAN